MIDTWPLPSMFAARDSRRTTWSCTRRSSAASSIVMIRSSSGMKPDMMLRSVVFPEPVPPEMNMLSRASTHARMNSIISAVAVPNLM